MVFNRYRQGSKEAGTQEPCEDAAETKEAEKESRRRRNDTPGCIRQLAELGCSSKQNGCTQRKRRNQKVI